MSSSSHDITPTPSPQVPPTPLPDNERRVLQEQIDALRSRVHQNASPTPAVHYHDLKNIGNGNCPEEFSGKRSNVYSFHTQVRMYTALQPRQFSSNTTKVLFAASYLHGVAFNWFKPYFNLDNIDRPTWLDNSNEFSARLQDTFGDPEQARTAAKKIHDLKQTKSVGKYWANSFKDALALVEEPRNCNLLAELSIRLSSHIHEQEQEFFSGYKYQMEGSASSV